MAKLDNFVGRKTELDAFEACFTDPSSNGLYFYGPGGIGKTMLLRRLLTVYQEKNKYDSSFIDFFSTKNRSIEGLQTSIMESLNNGQAFQEIIDIRKKIKDVQGSKSFTGQQELILSLQRQIDTIFSFCCNQATKDRLVVLTFDSFEYVQIRDTGRWFVDDFLPYLHRSKTSGIIVVVSGRPQPEISVMPANIIGAELKTLSKEDVKEYCQKIGLPWDEDFYDISRGNPLLIELLWWREVTPDLLRKLKPYKDQQPLEENPVAMAEMIFDKLMRTDDETIRRVLWAMALFKRRFDIRMLRYLVNEVPWLRKVDYETVKEQLRDFPFVKIDEEQQETHLLHDIVIEPLTISLSQLNEMRTIQDDLFRLIVDEYYIEKIEAIPLPHIKIHWQAEQLGYITHRHLNDGIDKYKEYRLDAEQTLDYRFSELLWDELYEYLEENLYDNVEILLEQVNWLYDKGLYSQLERLSSICCNIEGLGTEDLCIVKQRLGFALMRQGKIHNAEKQFREARNIIEKIQGPTRQHIHLVEVESSFAQLAVLAGRYGKAAEHYWKLVNMSESFDELSKLAMNYSSLGYTLAMQGNLLWALDMCEYAFKLPGGYPHARRQAYGYINLAFVQQLLHKYGDAFKALNQGLQIAEQEHLREVEIHVLREIAYTLYLQGCHAREELQDYAKDCNAQAQALQNITIALDRARNIGHPFQISKSILQLAHIFEEVERLKVIRDSNETDELWTAFLNELIAQVKKIPIAEDVYCLFQKKILHFPDKTFDQLTILQKSVRLIEIGTLEIPLLKQSFFMLESQMELARVLLNLRAWEEVEKRVHLIENTKLGGYDADILGALCSLIRATLEFERGNEEIALKLYIEAFPALAVSKDVPPQLVNIWLTELIKRITALTNTEKALSWCQKLRSAWYNSELNRHSPSLIVRLQKVSHELFERRFINHNLKNISGANNRYCHEEETL